jgi:hypothetical protein
MASRKSGLIVDIIKQVLGSMLTSLLIPVFEKIAKSFRLFVMPLKDCAISIAKATAIRDRIPTSTRGLYRLAAALADSSPACKVVFPTLLQKRISEFERCAIDISLGYEMVALDMGKGKMKPCLFGWIENPPLVIEGLIKSAIEVDKFEPSINFSNHKDKVIVVQGTNKGGSVTVNLVCIANRVDGNTPQFCFPLAFYEDGKESHQNLASTMFNVPDIDETGASLTISGEDSNITGKPTVGFLQDMLDGKFQLLLAVAKSTAGEILNTQCLLLNFENVDSATNIQVLHHLQPDGDHCELANALDPKLRQQPELVVLGGASMDGTTSEVKLSFRLIASKKEKQPRATTNDDENDNHDSGQADFIGVALYRVDQNNTATPIYKALFSDTFVVPHDAEVNLYFYGILCFSADDLKLNIAVSMGDRWGVEKI